MNKNSQMETLNKKWKYLKFKILHNTNKKITNSNIYQLNDREILKILYLITFEDNLQNNFLNRASLKLLNVLSLNINTYKNNIITNNIIFKRTYSNTISLLLLYKLYRLKQLR